MKTQFEEMFPWEFARALAEAPICYVPLGVLEWHGEQTLSHETAPSSLVIGEPL